MKNLGLALLLPPKVPKGKKAEGKKVVPTPAAMKEQEAKTVVNALFEKRPKNFGVGQDFQPQKDLIHFMKWPCYIPLQWQRTIFCKCLQVPPAINQFTEALVLQTAIPTPKLVHKYRSET